MKVHLPRQGLRVAYCLLRALDVLPRRLQWEDDRWTRRKTLS
jgi:hypothetical protein